jgi:hypothetical protein
VVVEPAARVLSTEEVKKSVRVAADKTVSFAQFFSASGGPCLLHPSVTHHEGIDGDDDRLNAFDIAALWSCLVSCHVSRSCLVLFIIPPHSLLPDHSHSAICLRMQDKE